MNDQHFKPQIGITIGDYNGIGVEIIMKIFSDARLTQLFTPIIYGSSRIFVKYKKILPIEFSYQIVQNEINQRKVNIVNCWEDNHELAIGETTQQAGQCAYLAIQKAAQDLKDGVIHAVVTAPINKENIYSKDFPYAGHTEFFAEHFGKDGSGLMLLVSENLRIGTVTGHIPIQEVAKKLSAELLQDKLNLLIKSLKADFGIKKPKIAVLGLNPHAGENGLLGKEEQTIIEPVIQQFKQRGNLVFGAFPADGFFATQSYKRFDAVLSMYHDQGLIPFKMLAFETGVNYTAGLSVVRTSPDHGTAYNIAGKGLADESSMRSAIFLALDILKHRGIVRKNTIGEEEFISE